MARPGAAMAGAAALLLVGVGLRISNAFFYPVDLGFDAAENWSYVARLVEDWTLPAPDAGWSTSHPPLFYYLGAALTRALGRPEKPLAVTAIRLLNVFLGLGVVALSALVVARSAGASWRRTGLAGALVLFLPAHVLMSAMLSEEMLAAFLASLAVALAALHADRPLAGAARRQLAIGLAGGLALLTKLSGAVALLTIAFGQGLEAARARALHSAALPLAVLCAAALLSGGWYYARSFATYGYLYPYDLPAHGLMKTMPPGERSAGDYLRLSPQIFTDPQMLAPGLLRSVWGGTYVTVWFDGHRHFLPRDSPPVQRAGAAILILALLPTAAFAAGLARGARRAWRGEAAADAILVPFTLATLAGYLAFTWRNPWFATVKGTYLLGLSVPFAYYASEALERWMGGSARRSWVLGALLATLFAAVAVTFWFGLVFEKPESPGLPWLPGMRPR